jgi:membrane protein DedA with SNARE-associated domain
MRWPAFLLFNALGGIVWATVYGLGGYFLVFCYGSFDR